jgi:hypothetical protein
VATTAATKAALSTDDLLLALASEGEVALKALDGKFPDAVLALAWARGEIEFGQTKYVGTGNPVTAVTVHNGVPLPAPALVIEGGVEWTGPKQRWHAPFHKIKGAALPRYVRYQKYQLEVCVNKERDAWEWLEAGQKANGRETRYARRDIDRAEAEALFELRVQLTEKGAAALAN